MVQSCQKVHDIDEGVDSNLRQEKQVIKSLNKPVESHVLIESINQTDLK